MGLSAPVEEEAYDPWAVPPDPWAAVAALREERIAAKEAAAYDRRGVLMNYDDKPRTRFHRDVIVPARAPPNHIKSAEEIATNMELDAKRTDAIQFKVDCMRVFKLADSDGSGSLE